jgi:hypothetical protein
MMTDDWTCRRVQGEGVVAYGPLLRTNNAAAVAMAEAPLNPQNTRS